MTRRPRLSEIFANVVPSGGGGCTSSSLIALHESLTTVMRDIRVATAFCLTGLLAASFVQETDHGEQSHTVNIRDIHKQLESQRMLQSAYYRKRRGGEHIGMHNFNNIITKYTFR